MFNDREPGPTVSMGGRGQSYLLAFRFLALIPCLPFPGVGNATFEP